MTVERRLRRFIRRAGAYLLDMLILAVVLLGVQGLIWAAGLNPVAADRRPWPMHGWVFAGVTLPALLYFTVTVAARGATLGQGLLQLHVTRAGGEGRLSIGAALARTVVLLLPWELTHTAIFHQWWWALAAAYVGWAVLIGSVVLQREGRGLHDLVGGSQVVSGATDTASTSG